MDIVSSSAAFITPPSICSTQTPVAGQHCTCGEQPGQRESTVFGLGVPSIQVLYLLCWGPAVRPAPSLHTARSMSPFLPCLIYLPCSATPLAVWNELCAHTETETAGLHKS